MRVPPPPKLGGPNAASAASAASSATSAATAAAADSGGEDAAEDRAAEPTAEPGHPRCAPPAESLVDLPPRLLERVSGELLSLGGVLTRRHGVGVAEGDRLIELALGFGEECARATLDGAAVRRDEVVGGGDLGARRDERALERLRGLGAPDLLVADLLEGLLERVVGVPEAAERCERVAAARRGGRVDRGRQRRLRGGDESQKLRPTGSS